MTKSKQVKSEGDWKHISDGQNRRICDLEKMNMIIKECNIMLQEEVQAKETNLSYINELLNDVLVRFHCQMLLRLRIPFDKHREITGVLMAESNKSVTTEVIRTKIFELITGKEDGEDLALKLFDENKKFKDGHICLVSDETFNSESVPVNLNGTGAGDEFETRKLKNLATLTVVPPPLKN